MNLPQLPQDKANHLMYGAVIACVCSMFFGPKIAFGVVLAAGAMKELADWLINQRAISDGLPPPHGVELLDAVATWFGGALVVAPLLWQAVSH